MMLKVLCPGALTLMTMVLPAAAITLDGGASGRRYPLDLATAVHVAVSPGEPQLPSPMLLALSRVGVKGQCYRGGARSTAPGDDGVNCYANYALRLPPKGDNFKKNQSYDFVTVPVAPNGAALFPRVATGGNTTACVAHANGSCAAGFEPAAFEYFVGAAVEFGFRPYIQEQHGAVLVTLDPSLGAATVSATVGAAPGVRGTKVSGDAAAGSSTLVPFALSTLPVSVDELVTITVTSEKDGRRFVHRRLFLRTPPVAAGSAASMWQVLLGSYIYPYTYIRIPAVLYSCVPYVTSRPGC